MCVCLYVWCILSIVPVRHEPGCALISVLQEIGEGHHADSLSLSQYLLSQSPTFNTGTVVAPSLIISTMNRKSWKCTVLMQGCVAIYGRWLKYHFRPRTIMQRPCVIRCFMAGLKDDCIFNQLSPCPLHIIHNTAYITSRTDSLTKHGKFEDFCRHTRCRRCSLCLHWREGGAF